MKNTKTAYQVKHTKDFGWTEHRISKCWKDQRGSGRRKRDTQYRVVTLFALLVALLLVPVRADAMPKAWQGTPQFTTAGVTYRVKGYAAVVTKTSGKRVNIPAEVKYRGKWYEVRNIWDGALKGATSVTIHAELDGCESPQLWKKGVQVRVTHKDMYRWLKRTGAKVQLVHCDGCK